MLEINKNLETQTFMTALVKAQAEISHAVKDKKNPHFKSTYATLEAIIDAVKEPLNKNGIFYQQKVHERENAVCVETIFHGPDGQMSFGLTTVPLDKNSPQGYGSALTYAKRYSLATACGIGSDEDDDGNGAETAHKNKLKDQINKIGKPAKKETGIVKTAIIQKGLDEKIISEKSLKVWSEEGWDQQKIEARVKRAFDEKMQEAMHEK
tara:strand:+ start:1785 stop:2411 length:627 start_codon:yes stop_codon:yes gene_type:complete